MLKNLLRPLFGILLLLVSLEGPAIAAPDYRLGVVIVVDQFRADNLMRFKDSFQAPQASGGGYRLLMEKGAYFPLADHGLLQNMTGPGHAAILSGSYPYRNHISTNIWFDREKKRTEYCVRDDEAKIIGSNGLVENARGGVSPKHFNADTVGDQLKNVDRASRVVSISLKDRAAVLLGGKRTDATLWFDDQSCQWVSSQYFMKSLPGFTLKENEKLLTEKKGKYSWGPFKDIQYCSKDALQTPWAMGKVFDHALAAVDSMGLGRGKDTDLLLVSLSSHDYYGHHHGPNDPFMKDLVTAEDRLISDFLKKLSAKVPGGLKDVFVVLTGDHGIPPSNLPQERIRSENVPEDVLPRIAEETLAREFGKPKSGKWVEAMVEFQLYLSRESMAAAGISISDAIKPLREKLLKEYFIDQVWARDEILFDRKVPAGEYGLVADRTLSVNSGDVVAVLKPYFYSDSYEITHMTQYSYDRFVPLAFYGKTFKPGVYRQIAHVVDIAPTLSSVLGVLPPAQSEGRVLTEILR
jgi:predicted AlkP superfamily pyrophosphatase or phosphodiesterase